MPVGNYPITQIKCRAHALLEGRYKLWSWQLEDGAYDCPIEPLTQEFWQVKEESRLAHGILLPALGAQTVGDLLILVTKDLGVPLRWQRWGLDAPEVASIYRAIVKLESPCADLMRLPRFWVDRFALFKGLEIAFREFVLPQKDETGAYVRRLSKLEAPDIAQPDNFGVGGCPRCNLLFAFNRGLDVMKAYRIDRETIFVLGRCHYCQKVVATGINPYFYKGRLE